jgi:L-arabinose isomerase
MIDFDNYEIWFITGSQHLYGPETLKQVEADSKQMVQGINDSGKIPLTISFKGVLTTSEDITELLLQANVDKNCVGLITWMHTFSPAKMWIAGLRGLKKPFAHLHTQYNREIPWADIDMDFMNLNQSAHGDREFGFICTRMRLNRKVIVGHWKDDDVLEQIGAWARSAVAWHDAQGAKIARFGDNMRDVAVTEGDKVEAQIRLGYSVSGFGVGDLVEYVNQVNKAQIAELLEEYQESYNWAESLLPGESQHQSLIEAIKIEIGLRAFLENGHFKALTTTFENLHGLDQLPGIAIQRLMAEGYGFGAEGDWKTAALVRAMKVMGTGLEGGTSFMEDYTYNFGEKKDMVLGAHMLEICPTIADGKPSMQIHPLGIGGKSDPVRLVFDALSAPAINASIIDMGDRFRMIVNEVDVVPTEHPLPKLPVAHALWVPRPNLKVAATAWILAGGAHHTGFSQSLHAEYLENFAEMADMEFILIDGDTTLSQFKKELTWNELNRSTTSRC